MKLGKYQHSKTGKLYRVIGVAKHSETLEDLVVYEALYDNPKSKLWVRPKKMFLEKVTILSERRESKDDITSSKVPRFKLIESNKLYTIWIIPSPSLKKDLEKIVSKLAKKYHSPIFEPHMTLLGDTEIDEKTMIEKAKLLAAKLKSFPLELGEISFSTTYFQSVFVRVNCTPKLMEANLKAKEIYKRENYVFMPHMSLLYGDQEMELREKIIPTVKIPKNSKFIVDKIVVVPSTKDPKEWKHLAEILLGTNKC